MNLNHLSDFLADNNLIDCHVIDIIIEQETVQVAYKERDSYIELCHEDEFFNWLETNENIDDYLSDYLRDFYSEIEIRVRKKLQLI